MSCNSENNSIIANLEQSLHTLLAHHINFVSCWYRSETASALQLRAESYYFKDQSGSIFVVLLHNLGPCDGVILLSLTQTGLLSDSRSRASLSLSVLDADQSPVSPGTRLTDPAVGASILLWQSGDCEVGWRVERQQCRAELRQFSAAAATKKLTFLQLQPQRKVRSL